MALIKCPECGNQVSDKAEACIHCGYPLKQTSKPVRIELPREWNNYDIHIESCDRKKEYWHGRFGETAVFSIDEPVTVSIVLIAGIHEIQTKLIPGTAYVVKKKPGINLINKYMIQTVDCIT